MPGKTPQYLPASSATVLRPAFLPPNPKCSTDSSGLPDPLPPSDDPDWGQPCFPCDFLLPRRHRRRIQFSPQLPQDFREYFFRISLHRTSRFRPLQGWFTPLRRLAMLLQGRSPFSCDCTLSALITASLTPSVIGDRPSHPICLQQLTSGLPVNL